MKFNDLLITLIFLFGISATCSRNSQANAKGFKPLRTKMDLKDFSVECRKFIKSEIRPKWLLHSSGECYYGNRISWQIIIYNKDCFIGRNKQQIQSIFGRPTDILSAKESWEKYYIGEECREEAQYFNLQFHYDENDVLKNIGQGQIIKHH